MHKLPFDINLNDVEILKALIKANNKIGELNGLLRTLPNPNIILNAVILGEAKESSEIENIITTFDKLFKEMTLNLNDISSKEVVNYKQAILYGYKVLKEKGFISTNMLIDIHHIIEPNAGDIRRIPGTVIINTKTQEIVHTPPQNKEEILNLLSNMENYINDTLDDTDPIIKMALIHFQFESIHPFHDGNGRTGRILNILYLVLKERLSIPVLYLSKYINQNRKEYYEYLNQMQKDIHQNKNYLLFIIKGVETMSDYTISFINKINQMMESAKILIQSSNNKIYSKELVDCLFYDFYTKNEHFREKLGISRNTASKYLHNLVDIGILQIEKVGNEIIFKNNYLYELMKNW